MVLKALSPSIEYDDGEFRGTLYLDHSTISTVASGYTTKSYTVSATKEIDNLDTNDMAYVPDTTTKNGVTVQLQSVDWQVQGTSLVDDILVPAQYKAVATYAGRASYRAATGYVTTAKYIGDIVAEGIESVTYTVIYTGTPSSTIFNYVQSFLDGEISRAAFWELAKFKYPTHQISFHTARALAALKFERSYVANVQEKQ